MALTITASSNQILSGYRVMTWTLSGTPEIGQVVSWGVYSYTLSFTVSPVFLTVDLIGSKIAEKTNETTVTQWKSVSSAYSSFVQGTPLGFKPTASYNANTNTISLVLNTQNQFYLGTTSAPTVPVPSPVTPVPITGAPVPLTVVPAPSPTTPLAPAGFKYVDITAQSIGSDAGDYFKIYHTSTDSENNLITSSVSRSTLLMGTTILIPDTATSVIIVSTTGACLDHESTATITIAPTPTPGVTPTLPPRTPVPLTPNTPVPLTPTVPPVVPFPSTTYYRIEACGTGYDYTASKFDICIGGNLQGISDPYQLNDVVQFAIGTSCPAQETYCGTIVNTNFTAPEGADAIITRVSTISDCQDFLHCQN